jgi:hypothetical protein
MAILGQSLTENPEVLFFAIGVGLVLLFVYGLIFKQNSPISPEKSKDLSLYSLLDYENLVEKAHQNWFILSRHNDIYLGSLIVTFFAQKVGEFTGHPLLSNSLVISLTYLIAFTSCFRYLIKGKPLDEQLISCAMRGVQLENHHPAWGVSYFCKFVKSYQGLHMYILIFFRAIIPAWLLLCAIYFGVISRWSSSWSTWGIVSISLATYILIALSLWKIGCSSYLLMRKKGEEALA